MASALVEGHEGSDAIAAALEAPAREDVTDPAALVYRVFAEQTRSDLKALAACIRASRQVLTRAEVARIAVPTLVVAGDADAVSGAPDVLAAMIPDAEAVTLPGKDHMSAVGDRGHKESVLAFLDRNGA